MKRKKIPYGISNFETVVNEDYILVDKTGYIKALEEYSSRYLMFLRPRRFGKSLWCSILGYYYDVRYKDRFEELFGNTFIGKNPTPKHNAYLVMNFNFSGVASDSMESCFGSFRDNIITSIIRFNEGRKLLTQSETELIETITEPSEIMRRVFGMLEKRSNKKLYIIIDEYDHFTNELLAFDRQVYADAVTRNGFMRKFYEVLKEGTSTIVDRIFITGVTPVTLDSLTSGFNISANITLEPRFQDMMGFTHDELVWLVRNTLQGCEGIDFEQVIDEIRENYDGYSFDVFGASNDRLYNPEMALFYLNWYQGYCIPPVKLLDRNIETGMEKLRGIMAVGEQDQNFEVLKGLVEDDEVVGDLVESYGDLTFFSREHFVTLLFYLGVVTIRGRTLSGYRLSPPNYVIRTTYWRLFKEILEKRIGQRVDTKRIRDAFVQLGLEGKTDLLAGLIEEFLDKILSNRDFIKLDEKHVKLVLLMFAAVEGSYRIVSEQEASRGYIDVGLFARKAIEVKYEHIFELKYVKDGATDAEIAAKEALAEEQLKKYLAEQNLQDKPNLKAWILVFRGVKCVVNREFRG